MKASLHLCSLSLLVACSTSESATLSAQPAPTVRPADAPAKEVAPPTSQAVASAPTSAPTSAPSEPPSVPFPGMALDPTWPKEVYVMTDSVVLGAKFALDKGLKTAGWTLNLEGRPAIMLHVANKEMKVHTKLPPVAVMAIGYNSLWEKDRHNYKSWAARFDKQAEDVYKTLTDRGVKKVIWVMLREISTDNTPMKNRSARHQLEVAGFYFPYVNERLQAMRERHPGMALVDWPTAGKEIGNTYDAIHLNPKGAQAMTAEIMKTIGLPPPPPAPKKEKPATTKTTKKATKPATPTTPAK